MKKIIYLVLLILVSFNTFADSLLKDIREKVLLPAMSVEEKELVVNQAHILFEKFYVNLDHKKSLYKVDPVADLENLKIKLPELSEEEFHGELIRIFTSVKDYHVNYYLPYPYRCYYSYVPVYFYTAEKNKIVVGGLDVDALKSVGVDGRVQLGDELISYNKLSALDAVKEQNKLTSGSTPGAESILGAYNLTYLQHVDYLLPKTNDVEMTLKNMNGEIYTITLPWFTGAGQKCLAETVKKDNEGSNGSSFSIEMRQRFQKLIQRKIRRLQIPFIKRNLLVSKSKIKNIIMGQYEKIPSNDDVSYKVVTSGNRNYGFLKIESFRVGKSQTETLEDIKKILTEKFSDTYALVIDLRGNYGGQITYAESLAAMLYPKKVARIPFYVKANNYTVNAFDNGSWLDLVSKNVESNSIVGPNFLMTSPELKKNSQVYFGKVILLTNGECFSSCDLFSATMKDNLNVKIYGRQNSTFGGGANVWKFDDIAPALKKMNLPNTLPKQIGMRVTFRHAHRISTNQLIEDQGVASDEVIPTTVEDFLNPDSSSIVNKVINDLDADNNLFKSSEKSLMLSASQVTIHGSEDLSINAKVSGIDQLVIWNDLKESRVVDVTNSKAITIPSSAARNGLSQVEIFGFNSKENPNKSLARNSLYIEKVSEFKEVTSFEPLKDSFNYVYPKDNNCGWQQKDNSWIIPGDYCVDSLITLVMSLDLTKGTEHSIEFNIVGSTEKDYDDLFIQVIGKNTKENIIEKISGSVDQKVHFDLSKYTGEKVDIKFILQSDEFGGAEGISISNILVK